MSNILPSRRRDPKLAGKRWATTSNSALEEVASQLTYDTKALHDAMYTRKMANNVTSISFGREKVHSTNYYGKAHEIRV